ncbi:MAG: hypothetical protein ACJAXS_002170 [Colwellia sp.]|jgi:hypothetical protein
MTQITCERMQEQHTVKVNGGSGVLLQPGSTVQYSYIYTAKHNIQVTGTDANRPLIDVDEIAICCFDGTPIVVLDRFIHVDEGIDIAILIIPFQGHINLELFDGRLTLNSQVRLCGYPSVRRNRNNPTSEEYSTYNFTCAINNTDKILLTNENVAQRSELVGFSGGGVYTIFPSARQTLLSGIEICMDGDPSIEQHGRVQVIPVDVFNQIIVANEFLGQPLGSVFPLFLSDFQFLTDFIFELVDWFDSDQLNFIRAHLIYLAQSNVITVNVKPVDILKEFSLYLDVFEEGNTTLYNKKNWSSILELLVISLLIDSPRVLNISYIRELLNKKRLTFIDSELSWKSHLKKILCAKYDDLNDDGIILVRTNTASNVVKYSSEDLKKSIPHIARSLSDPTSISNIKKNNTLNRSLVDLKSLHQACIEGKEPDYISFNISNLEELNTKLSEEYAFYLEGE